MGYLFSLRIWAIMLLAAGYGWAGGHFIPADAPVWAYLFQFTLLLILFILASGFLKAASTPTKSPARIRRNIIGLNIYAVLTLLINIANIVRGATKGSQYGSHNSFADLVPVILILAGDVLWLVTSLTRPSLSPNPHTSGPDAV